MKSIPLAKAKMLEILKEDQIGDAPQRANPQFEPDVSAGNFLYLNNDSDSF